MSKVLKILIVLAGFLLLFSNMTNRFDPDLGWHLRFGKEAFGGYFSFTDSYTWGNPGWPWINHEWGGDLLNWLIYSKFGYLTLLAFTSTLAWVGYIVSSQRLNKNISIEGLLAALLSAWTVTEIAMMRLATLTVFFVAILLFTLSRIHERRLFWWWPLLIWVWSVIHGSWFIGVIIALVYWGAMLFDYLTAKYFSARPINLATPRLLIESLSVILLSVAATLINPYGLKIITEVTSYFHINYYKTRIAEWTGSYAYPIFLIPLLLGPALVILNYILWRKKRIPTGELLVTIMLSLAAIKYRRQWLTASLMTAPALRLVLEQIFYGVSSFIKESRYIKLLEVTGIISLILMCGAYLTKTNFSTDVWSDQLLLETNRMPIKAVNFLKQEFPSGSKIDLFNEFSWGGYLNWSLPQARVYIDGRGSGTWTIGTSTPFLKSYYEIMFNEGGLQKIENYDVKYILLRPQYPKDPNRETWLNKEFYTFVTPTSSQLLKELNYNPGWQRIYSDQIAEVWKKK